MSGPIFVQFDSEEVDGVNNFSYYSHLSSRESFFDAKLTEIMVEVQQVSCAL